MNEERLKEIIKQQLIKDQEMKGWSLEDRVFYFHAAIVREFCIQDASEHAWTRSASHPDFEYCGHCGQPRPQGVNRE